MVREDKESGERLASTVGSLERNEASRFSGKRSSKRLRAFLVMMGVMLSIGVVSAQKKDSCVDCHGQMEGEVAEPVQLLKNDVHGRRGLSCADCHRGNPNADDMLGAMSRQSGFIGRPKPKDIPSLCGSCHSNADRMKTFAPSLRVDQEQEYRTSVHGKQLNSGNQRVATCISCHGNHGIRPVNDPLSSVYALNVAETCSKCHSNAEYMRGFKVPSDQYFKYKTSVHAKALYERQDLSAPTCNDCHGNHGAAPPGITSVANVCGQCHARQSSLFAASPHKAAFDAMELGECIKCHSNHDILTPGDKMIGVRPGSLCIECHAQGDLGYQAAEKMRAGIDELAAGIVRAIEILGQAERAGMEVSRPKFELNEATDGLTHARVLIHAFSSEEIDKVIGPGLASANRGYEAGEAALAERSYRRKGLATSLFFILFLAVLVYLKIRQIENRQKGQ